MFRKKNPSEAINQSENRRIQQKQKQLLHYKTLLAAYENLQTMDLESDCLRHRIEVLNTVIKKLSRKNN